MYAQDPYVGQARADFRSRFADAFNSSSDSARISCTKAKRAVATIVSCTGYYLHFRQITVVLSNVV